MLNKLHSTVGIVRTVRNWPMALRDHMGFLRQPYICKIRNGPLLKLRGGTDDRHIMFEIYVRGCYREARIKPGAVVIDIGANIGCFSLLAAKNASRIFAYEPYPDNLSVLRENVALNQVNNIEVCPFAIGDSAGPAVLFIPDDDSHVARISLYPGRGTRTTQSACITLDQVVRDNGLEKIDLLKIDCQGAEYSILYGASPDTLRRFQQIITECERFDDRPDWSIQSLSLYLRDHQFNVDTNENLLYAWRQEDGCETRSHWQHK